MVDIYGDDPLWLRVVGFFFGCAHHGVTDHPDVALTSIQKCVGRAWHRGPHVYPKPWVAALREAGA